MTRFNNARFEFIFTNIGSENPRLFTTVQALFRAYDTSRLFRDLKLRSAIISEKKLVLLPGEQVYSEIPGVWNLANEQGNLGTFILTNVRLVWFANLAENFNVSIPHIQTKSLKTTATKFGPVLVVMTTQLSGGFTLGFRIDPQEKMDDVYKELSSVWAIFSKKPLLGISCNFDLEHAKTLEQVTESRVVDDVAVVADEELPRSVMGSYFTMDGGGPIRTLSMSPPSDSLLKAFQGTQPSRTCGTSCRHGPRGWGRERRGVGGGGAESRGRRGGLAPTHIVENCASRDGWWSVTG